MTINSKVLTGLPNLPDENIEPKKLWSEFLTVYRAIESVLSGISELTGFDTPDTIEIAGMDPTKYLLGNNIGRYYPTSIATIARGQLVSTGNGTLATNNVGLAIATAANSHAIGVANNSVGVGGKVEVQTQGITTAISGMVPGTMYYLSTTLGAIQNLRPVAVGQIVQPIGWALTSNQMLLSINSYWQQL